MHTTTHTLKQWILF